MTLRHIVSWKLSGEDQAARDLQATELVSILEPLADSVPSVRALSVHLDEMRDGTNWDLTLISDFDDMAGLHDYIVHPEHVAAAEVVKRHAVSRAGVDFTI